MYSWASVDVPRLPGASDDPLILKDTASGGQVPVGPESGTARMYVCGITPYDATHLGHANTYLTFDMIGRVWRDMGLEVNYTQNVTDVDDPLIERAAQTGQDWDELAEDQIELFRGDMEALRIIPPQHYVGAVESINLVVDIVERLESTGLVYQIDDAEHPDWYFRTNQVKTFGEVSDLDEAAMIESFRENGGDPERPGKQHPLDSLLWRFSRDGEPAWESSLGAGRPGWHIECVAMSLEYLGPEFDLQGGGSDLVFPHHEICAAQAFAITDKPMAKAYVHSGLVALDGEKMSKSKGNLELVSRLRKAGADPMAIRLALLDHHYRENWEWTPDQLDRAEQRLAQWRAVMNNPTGMNADETIDNMRSALRDDLRVRDAIAAVDTWVAATGAIESDDTEAPQQMRTAVDALLGIQIQE